jgi:hypothetical protein
MGTTMRCFALVAAVWMLQACTQQSVYEAVQNREKVLCEQQPPSEYRDCMARASKPYATYKREKEEAEQKN